MIISCKFNSVCNACKGPIAQGERIVWTKGVKGAWHCACHPEGIAVQEKVKASLATDATIDIPTRPGLSYLPFQRAGVAFAMARKSTLIADEMGLGKTIQAIGYINANPEVRRVLIVTLASLKLNWRRECERWLVRMMPVEVFPKTGGITIINYEQLEKLDPREEFDLLIVDEAHYVKNPKAKRHLAVKSIARRSARRLFLTGTPVANMPLELWPLLQILAPEEWDPPGRIKNPAFKKQQKLAGKGGFAPIATVPEYINVEAGEGAGFFRFAMRYCNAHEEWVSRTKKVWKFDGASNLPELQEKLRCSVMVRREKADVLKELPAKVRQIVPFEVPCQDVAIDVDGEWLEEVARPGSVAFTQWSSVRQDQGLAKVEAVIEHVREALESQSKIIVFAHHKKVIEALAKGLDDFGAMTITGDTSEEMRDIAVQSFQCDDMNCRVIIGSIGAMGTGLTLTASSMVVFAELDPRPYIMAQAEDRAHRIGQRDSVLVQYLVAAGTLDERIASILAEKTAVIAQVTTDRADYGTPQVLDELAFTSCTCLAAPGQVHESWCDYAGTVEPAKIESKAAPFGEAIPPERIKRILAALRTLSARCDGAAAQDGQGFNKFDSSFGKDLARRSHLTQKQAHAALRMLKKYRGQVGEV